MSRSGYTEDYGDYEPWRMNLYRGRVARSIQGKRGQTFLRDLLAALDAMPEKRLVADSFARTDGEVCALGCIAKARGIDTTRLDDDAHPDGSDWTDDVSEQAADALNIARPLAAEVMYMNDEWCFGTPEDRWARMRAWVAARIEGAT